MIITLDGPCASGKSTMAQALARRLGFYYLNTGWLYRAVAYLLVEKRGYVDFTIQIPIEEDIAYCLDTQKLVYKDDPLIGGMLFFEGINITPFLKEYRVDMNVALISPMPLVRALVSAKQKEFAATYDSIIEGRDTGSVVFPHADYKFYVTATAAVRAGRWQKDQAKRGAFFTLEEAELAIQKRDESDSKRSKSPLVIPKDAIFIDTSYSTIEQALDQIVSHICS